MSQIVVKRPPRVLPPGVPAGELAVQAPPELPRGRPEGVLVQLLPVLGMGSSVVFFFVSPQPFMRVMGALMLVSTLALAVVQAVRYRRGAQGGVDELRREYLEHLGSVRARAVRAARVQRDGALRLHPEPGQLWAVVAERERLWERRAGDADFGVVRVGLGVRPPALVPVVAAGGPERRLEPLSAGALRRFLAVHGRVAGLPVTVPLCAYGCVVVAAGGDPEDAPLAGWGELPGRSEVPVSGRGGDPVSGNGRGRGSGHGTGGGHGWGEGHGPGGGHGPAHAVGAARTEAVRGVARALLAQAVVAHSPADLVVAVVAAPGAVGCWDWVKWLPHARVPGRVDGAGAGRLFAGTPGAVAGLLEPWTAGRVEGGTAGPGRPHLLVVVDGDGPVAGDPWEGSARPTGVTVVEVLTGGAGARRRGPVEASGTDAGGPGRLVVRMGPGSLEVEPGPGDAGEHDSAGTEGAGSGGGDVPDGLSVVEAEALARRLAPLRVAGGVGEGTDPLAAEHGFAGLLGLGDVASVDPARTWRPRSAAERLRVPIGVDADGAPVLLDLKEAAQEGMGPHGLCVGATGSGKSELLRTLVLGLAVTHGSQDLNFVLADFKGGATFAGMARLPHVAAVITNLADDLALVDRMGDAVRGELRRRQELLRAAGGHASAFDYERARAAGAPLAPLPSLVLVIDEFSELLAARPDFIDMFLQIGRIGRSLGVHLLLASQRLEEGRLRGLETYLSYRIGLRTFSEAESRAALGVPDAFRLPRVPGAGLLRFGTEETVRFKAAYVSGPYRAQGAGPVVRRSGPAPRPVLFTAAEVPLPGVVAEGEAPSEAPFVVPVGSGEEGVGAVGAAAPGESVLEVLVGRLEGAGPPAHQVWLPPLEESSPLDALPVDGVGRGGLVVPLGLVDRPFEQRREVLSADFSGAEGHLLVVGGPRSGKSLLLRTLVAAFALTHDPGEAQFYALDFGGGGLAAVAGLPHVGGVASRLDPERVRRTVAEVAAVLARREADFRALGVDSMAAYRELRASGKVPGDRFGDVFLLVDGWGAFRTEYEELEPVVADLAARGLGYGVHLVLTASRYLEVRAALKDQLAGRLELRLGDPVDSEFDRRVAATVPRGLPGRGQVPEGLHFMGAVPRADGVAGTAGLPAATAELVASVRAATASRPSAPEVRLLPRLLPSERLPKGSEFPGRGIAIGAGEADLEPVFVDFDTDPFLLVFGGGGAGKTALLRLLVRRLTERYSPAEARFVVGDVRRSLLGAVPESHLLEYAATGPALEGHVAAVASLIGRRAPEEGLTARQLREGGWWTGPRLFVVVDDYELVSSGPVNPLAPLLDQLPFARDLGVRVVLARSSAGAGRASYEPVLQRVRELGAQGVVLSGDRSEGELLGGVRARPLPPGRGVFVPRGRGASLVQVGWVPEA
ncbi:type VII secretion protein EccCb [Streptomyces sp. NPDC097619]|uniref:type VII secretion protein EccCb n=1 Tax=Streptomyces sp. NPDC097619 TaxID=3157228 RepID=UPI00331DBFB5